MCMMCSSTNHRVTLTAEDVSAFSGSQAVFQGATDTVPGGTSSTFGISVGTPVFGVVNTSGDQDWYRITVVAG